MTRTACVIASPYQLMSLFEALTGGHLPWDVRVLLRGDPAQYGGLRRLWEAGGGPPLDVGFAISARDVVREVDARTHLVLGDPYSSLGQATTLARRPGRLTLLDDGMSMFHTVEMLATAGNMDRPSRPASGQAKALQTRRFTDALRGLAERNRLSILTGLPADDLGSCPGRVSQHVFDWARSTHLPWEIRPLRQVLFGSALAADDLIDRDAYQQWIAAIVVPGETYFFPHRREGSDTLRFVRSLGAQTASSGGLPVELIVRQMPDSTMFHALPSTVVFSVRSVRDRSTSLSCSPIDDTWWCPDAPPSMRWLVCRVSAVAAPCAFVA